MKKFNQRIDNGNRKLSYKKGSKKDEDKSGGWLKQNKVNKLANLNKRMWVRNNVIEETVAELIKRGYTHIAIEDLSKQKLTKRATEDDKGVFSTVKQKSKMNRNLLDISMYKLEMHWIQKGGKIIKVDPKNTSRECNKCGHTDIKNRKTVRQFECLNCGYQQHADVSAALNIRKRAIK